MARIKYVNIFFGILFLIPPEGLLSDVKSGDVLKRTLENISEIKTVQGKIVQELKINDSKFTFGGMYYAK